MKLEFVVLMIFSVFISAVAQMILKICANKKFKNMISEYLNPYVVTAYAIFLISTILTTIAYRGVYLKAGPIIESLGFVFVFIFARYFLKEKKSKFNIIGIFVLIAGVIIFNLK